MMTRLPCKWLYNHYCGHPLLIHTGCKYHEVENKLSKCKHLMGDGQCVIIDGFECPFTNMWDIAKKLCKNYEVVIRFEVHVIGKEPTIIGVFNTREQAEQLIRDNIKVVEMML